MKLNLVSGDKNVSLRVRDYWEQSVDGFGSYSAEISKSMFSKLYGESWLIEERPELTLTSKSVGDSRFVIIQK